MGRSTKRASLAIRGFARLTRGASRLELTAAVRVVGRVNVGYSGLERQ